AEDHDGSRPARAIGTVGNPGTEGSSAPATEFTDRLHHERELVSPGEAGPLLVGEDFRYTTSRTFDFTLTGAADGPAWLRCSFVSNMSTSGSRLAFSVGGQQLQATSSDRVNATSSSAYVHGTETVTTHSFDHPAAATMKVGISFNQNGTCRGAWLNSLTINYTRRLELSSAGTLLFNSDAGTYSLGGASESLNLWDVTDPAQIGSVNFDINAGRARWTLHGKRKYIAWNKGANLPMPELIGTVPNQNLHALDGADMVIVAPAAFSAQANRLAEYHASTPDSLRVIVADPEKIYNEFGSGSPDVGAIRRFFKMLYDRGNSGMGRPLRYAIMMARTTFDYRRLTTSAPSYPIIPAWMPSNNRASLSDNEGYSTDDICAMLDDGSGADLRFDKLSIAIGRMPATDLAEARSMVDKELQYARSARKTAWKQRFLFLADDEDNGVHLEQTEKLVNAFDGKDGNRNLVRKIYIDAYQKVGSSYPVARELMYRNLDEGVVWWNFIGHANTTSWTSEGMLTYTDINRMYLRHWPFIYAATCNFLRLDGREISGAEIMYKERYGGAIGIISAVRPVYISDNGVLSAAIGRAMAKLDSSGRPLTPGEIYRQAKNESPGSDGDLNRLRYIFMGDPALPLALPANVVAVDSIAGMDLADGDTQAVMPALARVKVTGKVTDPQGNILSGFNGTVMIDIFDAERSVTSLGHGDKGKEITFEEYGDRIYTGAAEVTGGRFSAEIAMPAEISQNFRPATMSLYAFDTTDDTDAAGLEHRFYVFGY
ncbi:MAG: type IX secretion system sortase PorU, partial [Muribaculaceae bacterium]|nr:type IX secretion system sortase PorU [Muribaculaceae bacterium]